MKFPPPPINPQVLQWARNQTGFNLDEVASRAGIKPLKGGKNTPALTPAQRLEAWEKGEHVPSWNQLKDLATAYRRPIITFFREKLPTNSVKYVDFRIMPTEARKHFSPEFSALLRRITILRWQLIALAKEEHTPPLTYVGVARGKYATFTDNVVEEIVNDIRVTIGFSFEEQIKIPDGSQLFRILREKIQDAGVYVLLEGNLGSYHTNISPEEFRGAAFADSQCPLIVINPNDAMPTWIYTLIHELAHIWLGSDGISNICESTGVPTNDKIEYLCYNIAYNFLLPRAYIASIYSVQCIGDLEALTCFIEEYAKKTKVHQAAFARRLSELGYISGDTYSKLIGMYKDAIPKRGKRIRCEGGTTRIAWDAFRLGDKVLKRIIGAAYEGEITLLDASRVLKVPVCRFEKLLS